MVPFLLAPAFPSSLNTPLHLKCCFLTILMVLIETTAIVAMFLGAISASSKSEILCYTWLLHEETWVKVFLNKLLVYYLHSRLLLYTFTNVIITTQHWSCQETLHSKQIKCVLFERVHGKLLTMSIYSHF